jgi:NO-binding membrane sensor protein with MHYT domain
VSEQSQLVASRGHRSMIISIARSHYLAMTSVDIAHKVALKMEVCKVIHQCNRMLKYNILRRQCVLKLSIERVN